MIPPMGHTSVELKVTLRDVEPPIWRRIEMPGTATLEDLHLAIQVAMGWQTEHLHQFIVGKARYGAAGAELDGGDQRGVTLEGLGKTRAFVYEYDMGDSWRHDVKVEKISEVAKPVQPRCTAGARACPPEDCGGAGGYEDLVAGLKEADGEGQWGDFDPERFELPEKGRLLAREMAQRSGFGSGADDDAGDGDDDEVDPETGLPMRLVEAVLELPPLQRAALGALIMGTLASELIDANEMAAEKATRGAKRARRA